MCDRITGSDSLAKVIRKTNFPKWSGRKEKQKGPDVGGRGLTNHFLEFSLFLLLCQIVSKQDGPITELGKQVPWKHLSLRLAK